MRPSSRKAPKTGPLVIVANHPYGVLDGLVIGWLTSRSGPISGCSPMRCSARPRGRPFLLPVDFSGTPDAIQTNLASRAAARD